MSHGNGPSSERAIGLGGGEDALDKIRHCNRAENQLSVVPLGRKNWLFAGSLEGARRAALLYALVQSCKLVDVKPFDYLKDVLRRVATHPQSLVHQLTPRAWAATFGRRAAA